MVVLPFVGGFMGPSLVERKQILWGKVEYLRARMDDLESIERRVKKRKRDDDSCVWVDEGWKLLKVAENLLTQVECGSTLMRLKKKWVVDDLVRKLALHEKEGATCMQSFSDEEMPYRGDHIPVKQLGQGRTLTLVELEHLLQDPKVGQVAILGRQGIGKSFLMKHLHNSVLKWIERFNYVFWVTSPGQFSIKRLQDALAAMVKCDLASEDDLNIRARKLSNALASLGSFVLFIDGIPGNFSLEQIGIFVPSEGSKCKVVLTTSSSLGCRILDGFRTVELDFLPDEQAFELFISEAKIDVASITFVDDVPRLLVRKCGGVPRLIVDLASRMCGINDAHEWRNALFEFEYL